MLTKAYPKLNPTSFPDSYKSQDGKHRNLIQDTQQKVSQFHESYIWRMKRKEEEVASTPVHRTLQNNEVLL